MDRYAKTFTIHWRDCDMNGHVQNTIYNEYCIDTRMAYLTEHGFGYAQLGEHRLGPVALREEIDYLREIGFGETITVDMRRLALSPEGAKFNLAHDVYGGDGKQAARIVFKGAWMDLDARRIVPAPPALLAAMRDIPEDPAFEELPPLGSSKRK